MEYPKYEEITDKEKYLDSIKKNIVAILSVDSEEKHKKDLLDICIWHLTEINGKYNTRYRSEGAMNKKNWSEVQHEHVFQRKKLILRLLENNDVESVMRDAVACLVTKKEHQLLSSATKGTKIDGWERYKLAGIKVYDLQEKALFNGLS